MDTLLVDQPSILAPEDDLKLTVQAAVTAALAEERERFLQAAVRAGNYTGHIGAMQRAIQRVYPDVSNAEWYARRDGRPWPADVPDDGTMPGCTCATCTTIRARRRPVAPVPPPVEETEPERECSCEGCIDPTCAGANDNAHERCDSYFCAECHGDCRRESCCGWDRDCDIHLEYDDASTCDQGHCHSCDHECEYA